MHLKLSTVTMMIKHWHWQKLLWSLGTTLTIAATGAPRSVMAAESIYLKAGPFQTKVNVEDLEEFSRTGKIPSTLGFYSFVLTPSVRTLLNQNVDLDQPLVKDFIVSFLGTTEAQNMLDQLAGMFPKMSGEELAIALKLTIAEADELNLISLIRAYPNQSITLDLAAGVTMLLQFNAAQLQSQLLVPTLEAEFAQSNEQNWEHTTDLTAPGNEIITTETLFLKDQKRDRTVTVDLYHSSQAHKPLVVMSHGFASDRRFLKYLAMHLASHGYSVVSIEHKGSNIGEYLTAEGVTINPGEIIDPQEFINRPQDVSFVIDELTRLQQDNRTLNRAFDPNQVVMIGHSLGGYTALALAGAELDVSQVKRFCDRSLVVNRSPADWLQCEAAKLPPKNYDFKDGRVKQLMVLNPIAGNLFTDASLGRIMIPTLMLTSTQDRVTPIAPNQLQPFEQLGSSDRFLVAAMKATHMSVTDAMNQTSLVGQNPLFQEILGVEAEPLRDVMKGLSLAFIDRYSLHQDESIEGTDFLSNGYVQSFNTSAMGFGLTTNLSDRFNQWLKLAQTQELQPSAAHSQPPNVHPINPGVSLIPIARGSRPNP